MVLRIVQVLHLNRMMIKWRCHVKWSGNGRVRYTP